MRELSGKRVLVTGGARGIGLALARRFAREGAEPILVDLDEAALREGVERVRSEGATASGHRADVTDPDDVAALRQRLLDAGGPIDVLVNNAGVVYGGAFLDVPLEHHRRTHAVNTEGPVVMAYVFLPDLIGRPAGHVVNVSSASGFVGLPYGATYAASKWALIGFSESLRLELRELGHDHVGVTTVCPSYVATELFRGARPPRATRLLDPDRLADEVVRAVRRGRTLLVAPRSVRWLVGLRGMLPRPAVDALSRWLGTTTGMRHWKGRSAD